MNTPFNIPGPSWCVADHAVEDEPGDVRHRSETIVIPAILEGRGGAGPHSEELLVERARKEGGQTWIYVGDGWTGFSLTVESARRLADALYTIVADPGEDEERS